MSMQDIHATDETLLSAREKAVAFVRNEKQFHLGVLPTEQSHPKTAELSDTIQKDTAQGIRLLQSVDYDIVPVAASVLSGKRFARMVESISSALQAGGRVFFSGCGATGRLSIQLEAAWRQFWQQAAEQSGGVSEDLAYLEDRVFSVMTGGDRALIRSVENFEDYISFGRYQISQHNLSSKDVVVAISEGGETSSVIGTALQGVDVGATVFFVYNNPTEILCKHVERSRDLIQNPKVIEIDVATGPMAVAGSTRMQATSIELLVVGAALEMALVQILTSRLSQEQLDDLHVVQRDCEDYARIFSDLLEEMSSSESVTALAGWTEYEEQVYLAEGLVTYMSHDYLLDIFTDTTERAPTFMLPPFRRSNDTASARSWAFVKNPVLSTAEAWRRVYRRVPRGLTWDRCVYEKLGASTKICTQPPSLDNDEIMRYQIGNEDDQSRYTAADSVATLLLIDDEALQYGESDNPIRTGFHRLGSKYRRKTIVSMGPSKPNADEVDRIFHIPCTFRESPLKLFKHLGLKLVLNTISTATMARMGRVEGNWMVYAEATNKKLIDRGTRLIQHLTGEDYLSACKALHETMAMISANSTTSKAPLPPTILTIQRIRQKQIAGA